MESTATEWTQSKKFDMIPASLRTKLEGLIHDLRTTIVNECMQASVPHSLGIEFAFKHPIVFRSAYVVKKETCFNMMEIEQKRVAQSEGRTFGAGDLALVKATYDNMSIEERAAKVAQIKSNEVRLAQTQSSEFQNKGRNRLLGEVDGKLKELSTTYNQAYMAYVVPRKAGAWAPILYYSKDAESFREVLADEDHGVWAFAAAIQGTRILRPKPNKATEKRKEHSWLLRQTLRKDDQLRSSVDKRLPSNIPALLHSKRKKLTGLPFVPPNGKPPGEPQLSDNLRAMKAGTAFVEDIE